MMSTTQLFIEMANTIVSLYLIFNKMSRDTELSPLCPKIQNTDREEKEEQIQMATLGPPTAL